MCVQKYFHFIKLSDFSFAVIFKFIHLHVAQTQRRMAASVCNINNLNEQKLWEKPEQYITHGKGSERERERGSDKDEDGNIMKRERIG